MRSLRDRWSFTQLAGGLRPPANCSYHSGIENIDSDTIVCDSIRCDDPESSLERPVERERQTLNRNIGGAERLSGGAIRGQRGRGRVQREVRNLRHIEVRIDQVGRADHIVQVLEIVTHAEAEVLRDVEPER